MAVTYASFDAHVTTCPEATLQEEFMNFEGNYSRRGLFLRGGRYALLTGLFPLVLGGFERVVIFGVAFSA